MGNRSTGMIYQPCLLFLAGSHRDQLTSGEKEWLMALVGKTEAKTYPSESNHAKLRSLAANTS